MSAINEISKHFASVSEIRAAAQDAARREDDHGPALAMNAEHDRARLQALAEQHLADNHNLGALTDAADDDLWPTAAEIVDAVVEATGFERRHVIESILRCDFAAELAQLEQAA